MKLPNILTFTISLLTSVSVQTGNEAPSSASHTYTSASKASTCIADPTYDPPGKDSIVARMNAASGLSPYATMRTGPPHDFRVMSKQHDFVPFPGQKKAQRMVKRTEGYIHNTDEQDLAGIRRCHLIPIIPPVASVKRVTQYVVVCEVIPMGGQSRSGPLTYVEALGTQERTLNELKENFMGEDLEESLWKFVPIPRFRANPHRRVMRLG